MRHQGGERRHKRDRNHRQIQEALRSVTYPVEDTSRFGKGWPDIIARHRKTKAVVFIEIKDGNKSPSARKLTPDEEAFAARWEGVWVVVTNIDEALRAVGV